MENRYSCLKGTAALFAVLSVLALCVGCAARKQERVIRVLPAASRLVADPTLSADLCVRFDLPPLYHGRRSRLFISPVLVAGDSVCAEGHPVVLDAPVYTQKRVRREVLYGEYDSIRAFDIDPRDSVRVRYAGTFVLPPQVAGANLRAVVSADGCGTCSGIDTLDLGVLTDYVPLLGPLKERWMESVYDPSPKLRRGKGVARLHFVINRHDINLSLGANRAEMERMLHTLRPIVADTLASLDSVHVVGVASADGSWAFNSVLARNRAVAARNWLLDSLRLDEAAAGRFTVDSRPEGWLPLLVAMRLANDPDTAGVASLLDRFAGENDDTQEYEIRRLPGWKRLSGRYLPKDRKVEYEYFYHLRGFDTDAELLALYGSRPDAFSESEFMRVASLRDTPAGKLEVYGRTLHYYPASCVAGNNAALLHLRGDSLVQAGGLLEAFPDTLPCLAMTKAALYARLGEWEKAESVLRPVAPGDPEARYNLGLVAANRRRWAEADSLLAPFADVNVALAALAMERTAAADTLLRALPDSSARAEYARALVAARLGRTEEVRVHLQRAVADETLRRRLATDPELTAWRKELAGEQETANGN